VLDEDERGHLAIVVQQPVVQNEARR
jgi:hypothetical protein